MPLVDQNQRRRRGTGLMALDEDASYGGYTLFAPLTGSGEVYLIDMRGEVVHRWNLPYRPGRRRPDPAQRQPGLQRCPPGRTGSLPDVAQVPRRDHAGDHSGRHGRARTPRPLPAPRRVPLRRRPPPLLRPGAADRRGRRRGQRRCARLGARWHGVGGHHRGGGRRGQHGVGVEDLRAPGPRGVPAAPRLLARALPSDQQRAADQRRQHPGELPLRLGRRRHQP